MASERITIGALARRSGVPVKTLRFYSDEGLLPIAGRTGSGYRLYAEEAVARIDLIRTLREAGLGIAEIRAILGRELALGEALRMRLGAVEAHIDSLQQVAAALRAALRADPQDADIRRLCTVTRLSTEQRRAIIINFCERIARDLPGEEGWKRQVIEASAPRLPEQPTPEQLDAWIELAELVQDEGFVAAMQAAAARSWRGGLDLAAQQQVHEAASGAARSLIERGLAPTDGAAREVVERLVVGLAAAMGRADDAGFRAELRAINTEHDPRVTRYWALVGVLAGQPAAAESEVWRWLSAATVHHLAPA